MTIRHFWSTLARSQFRAMTGRGNSALHSKAGTKLGLAGSR